MTTQRPSWFEDGEPGPARPAPYRNTVGSIVAWALLRAAIYVLLAVFTFDFFRWMNYSLWWTVCVGLFYAFVIYPIQVQYRLFHEETRSVMSGTLCSTCRHFEPTGVLCAKLDEHVTEEHIPCEGQLWEPASPALRGEE
jgi:hypothetical protein